jgi:hypothetical protein
MQLVIYPSVFHLLGVVQGLYVTASGYMSHDLLAAALKHLRRPGQQNLDGAGASSHNGVWCLAYSLLAVAAADEAAAADDDDADSDDGFPLIVT